MTTTLVMLWCSVGSLSLMGDTQIRFTEFLIRDGYRYAYGVSAADIDRDGKIDLISADIAGEEQARRSTLYWFRNDGKGGFEPQVIWRDEPGWFERNALADLNGN